MTRVVIVQSNYLPWKGYFDLIAAADDLVLLDTVQYTRRDWRNRNLIKTPRGREWLTVPVKTRGRYHAAIAEIEIDGTEWRARHLDAIARNYAAAPWRGAVLDWLVPCLEAGDTYLSTLNRRLIEAVCGHVGITTRLHDAAAFAAPEEPTARLVAICAALGADAYLSGPAARSYLDEARFAEAGIAVEWFDYAGYPEYDQQWGPFEHGVSVIDLMMNCGPEARAKMLVAPR